MKLSDHLSAGSYTDGCEDWRWGGIVRQHGGPVFYCAHTNHTSAAEARACAQKKLDDRRAFGTNPCRDHFPDDAKGLLFPARDEFYPWDPEHGHILSEPIPSRSKIAP